MRRRKRKRRSMYLVTLIQMRKMLNNLKHYWPEDSTKVKVILKVNYLSFVSIAMRLVRLLLDVQRRRKIEVETNTEVEEMRTRNIKKIKARSLATLLKRKPNIDLIIVMMKWCMLQ